MAQQLWDETEKIFTIVRFDRSLTRADIARLAEQYLDSASIKHEGLITYIGRYPKSENLPGVDNATPEDGIIEGIDFVGDGPKGTLNDPAEWVLLYEGRLEVLKRDRSLNNLASYRSAAGELAFRNEIDLDSTAHEDALCRALLDAEIKVAEDMLTYLRDVVLPHHPLHAAAHRSIVSNPPSRSDTPAKDKARQTRRLFSDVWVAYTGDRVRHNEWKESIARQAQSTGRLFTEICGDKPLVDYGPADAAEFRRALLSLPGNYDKCIEWRDIQRRAGICGLIEHCNGKTGIDRLKPQTFNRHLAALSGIWPWAQVNEVVAKGAPSIFEGLHINVNRARGRHHRTRDERPAWNQAELEAVLNADLFFGIRSRRSWKKAGLQVLRDERYWGILIGAHSGMRRGEIFQLRVRHVVKDAETGIWHFNLVDPALELKAEGSARWIPLHQNLLSLGVIEALVEGRGENEMLLCEGEAGAEKKDVLKDGESTSFGSSFGKWFQRFKSHHGVRDEVVFHSFRHSATTLLCNVGVQRAFVEELIGHESSVRRSEMDRYNKGQTLQTLKDVVDRLVLPIDVPRMIDAARNRKPV